MDQFLKNFNKKWSSLFNINFEKAKDLANTLNKNIKNLQAVKCRYQEIKTVSRSQAEKYANKSISDGKFSYNNWKTKYLINETPRIEHFNFNSEAVISPENNKETSVFVSSQNKSTAMKIIKRINNSYQDFDFEEKLTVWSLLAGFECIINKNFENKIVRSRCKKQFFVEEIQKKRLIKIDQIKHPKFIVSPYFEIKEEKIDALGNRYNKIRHVADGTYFNEFLELNNTNFSYNFPMAWSLFKNKFKFEKLQKAKMASVFDKTEFYRDIPVIPNEFSYVFDGKFYYVDLKAKMGHKFSSAFSQLTSNLLDKIFNDENEEIDVTSLQDDSIFLQTEEMDPEKVYEINETFGFSINNKKTQLNKESVEWSGMNFDFVNKTLSVPVKKIDKLKNIVKDLSQNVPTRRDMAKILGKIHAMSLISSAFSLNLSSLTRKSRNFMFKNADLKFLSLKDQWFYEEKMTLKESYEKFFSEKIDKAPLEVMNELSIVIQILEKKAKFIDVRQNIFTLNELVRPKMNEDTNNSIFVDASGKYYGIHIIIGEEDEYSFQGKFETQDLENSINLKEFFCLVLGVMVAVKLDVRDNMYRTYTVYCDNSAAEMLAVSKKANVRNIRLGKLAEILSWVQYMSRSKFYIFRVDTLSNKHADTLSRRIFNHRIMGISITSLLSII